MNLFIERCTWNKLEIKRRGIKHASINPTTTHSEKYTIKLYSNLVNGGKDQGQSYKDILA